MSDHSSPLSEPDSEFGQVENEALFTYALQVRAFIDASEDVDADPETLEDIVDGFLEAYAKSGGGGLDENNTSKSSLNEILDAILGALEYVDISTLHVSDEEVSREWTKQEINNMKYHLKERGMDSWTKEYHVKRNVSIPRLLLAFKIDLCKELCEKRESTLMYFLQVAMSRELQLRERLPQYSTIDDAVALINSSNRILILTGAGISVSCGIPDFRSRDGLYASLKDRPGYELDDPQQMFDIHYFKENPSGFSIHSQGRRLHSHTQRYMLRVLGSQIYPSNFTPSPCHRFIKLIEEKAKLLRNYTQNIDTLETQAGVQRVLQCHGSFASASCLECRRRVPGKEIEVEILNQKVALCTVCNDRVPVGPTKKGKRTGGKKKNEWDTEDEDKSDGADYPPGIMKPDITFFGEKLSDEFECSLLEDRMRADLLIIIGTSLKVAPVSDILLHLPHSIPQILINKTPVKHINPDIVLLGNADDIVIHLCNELGWDLPPPPPPPPSTATRLHLPRGNLKKRPSTSPIGQPEPRRVGDSHVWLFQGAEGGKWVQDIEKIYLESESAPSGSGHEYKKQRVD